MRLKAVLFDMDGLIFDTEKIYFRYWKQAARECGYDLSDDLALQMRSCDKTIGRKILAEAFGASDGGGAHDVYDRIKKHRKEQMKDYLQNAEPEVKPGVRDFLAGLHGISSLRKAIVTQSSLDEKRELLRKSGLLPYFDDIISGTDVKLGKPFPDIYLYACKKLGLAPQECLAYEDSPNGIRSAHAAGVRVIMIPDLTPADEEMRSLCEAVFPRIDQSLEYIRNHYS